MAEKPTDKHIYSALCQAAFELGLAPKNEKLRAILDAAAQLIAANLSLTAADVPWLPPGEHFVMVTERDTFQTPTYAWDEFGIPYPEGDPRPPHGPLTFEHYLGESTSRDAIAKHVESMGGKYGRKAIARLVFVRADL